MQYKEVFQKIVDSKQSEKSSARSLLSLFGYSRRGYLVCQEINNALKEYSLKTEPYWADIWIDEEVTISPAEKTTGNSIAISKSVDTIKRIKLLNEANEEPKFTNLDDKIEKATTLMQLHSYSQLPVSNNGHLQVHSIVGYISWKTIAIKNIHGKGGDFVRDYLERDICILPSDTPILKALEDIHKHGFILVSNNKKRICGMITTTQMSSTYKTLTDKFLLIEQIERQVRAILNGKFTLGEINDIIKKEQGAQEVNSIDELTFGQYLRIIEGNENWEKLNLKFDKKIIIEKLTAVKNLRNDIMHFDPTDITPEQVNELSNVSDFLNSVITLSEEKNQNKDITESQKQNPPTQP